MKKQFLLLAALVLSAGQVMADRVSYTTDVLYKTLPSDNKKVAIPFQWETAPYLVTVNLAKEGTASQGVASGQMSLAAGYTITVSVPGTLDGINLTASTASRLANITADNGTYANGVWAPAEGESTSTVVFTTTNTVPLKSITVDYTPGQAVSPLDYVHYDGRRRENCFATDITPVTETQIAMGFNVEGGDGEWRAIFCGRNVGAGTGISLYKNGNQNNLGYFTGGTTGAGDGFAPLTCGQDYEVIADVTKLQWSTDGGVNWDEKETGNSVTNETSRVLTFFGQPEWDAAMKGKVYYLTIKNGNEVIRSYSPAITHDGKIGFWEKYTSKFIEPREKSQAGYSAGYMEGTFYLKGWTEALAIPADATGQIELNQQGTPDAVKYYSANTGIATVDENGKVTGVKVGKTTIYTVIDEPNGRWVKTTEVEVTGAAKNQYSLADYISFDGPNENYKYYFETGYLPKYNTVIDLQCKAYDKSKGNWRAVFSGRDNTSNGMSLYMNGSGDDWGYFVSGNNEDWAGKFHTNTDYTVNFTKDALTVNGEVTKTKSGITEENFKPGGHTISIFSGANDWPFYGEISYFKISEGETVVHEYVPAIRHDGVPALYCKTCDEYIEPKNANGFKAGVKEGSENSIITLTETAITTFKGFTTNAKPNFLNCNAEDYTISYACADENVATVNEAGEIVGAGVGTTDVTVSVSAKASDEVWVFSMAVTVQPSVVVADHVEEWNGTNDAIVGSIRWGGDSYKPAYTVTFDSGKGFSGAQNTSNPEFNKVWGEPATDDAGRAWYAADYDMTNTASAVWSYNSNVLPNNWPGNMGEVYVRRYFKAEGELPAQLYMPAPHDDAPCEYYINGTLVWARTGLEPGVDGWYEAEVVKLNDSQRALIKTDGSVNVFAYHVHQNWGGRYADGGIYGNSMADNSPSKSFESNENLKRLAVAVAQAEGVDGIPADVLEYCQNATVCMQDVNHALNMIRFELRKALSPRHNYTMASAEPADNLEVWLYNVGTGQFLSGNNDWGTHASVDYNISAWPMILHTNTSGANRYSIQTNLPNGRRGNNDWLGHNGYVDCSGVNFGSTDWAWEFKPVGNGNYYIINSQNGGDGIYLGVTEDDRYQVDTNKSGADNLYNQWKVITRDMLEALAAEATEENPADVSYYIHQNTFSQNDFDGDEKDPANGDLNKSTWERNQGSIWNWKGNDANGDYVFEMWNTRDAGKVYLKQTIENLPAGKYIVECTGFYRDGNWDAAVGGASRQLAYLYAGTEENHTLLPNILDGAGQGAGYGRIDNAQVIPDGCNQAPKFFRLGTYTVQAPVVTVGFDGKLEIGVVRDAEGVSEQDWIVLDNFRLYRVGKAPAEVTVGEALWATYVAPVDVEFRGEGIEAYAAQVKGEYVHLEKVTTVPAGTAVVVKAQAPATYIIDYAEDAILGTENDLVASKDAVVADGTQYILAQQGDEVGFAKAAPESTIAACKGYLVISAGIKAFYPFGEENATGIETIATDNNETIYNLAGQRLQKAQKGVNIIGSKKVLK